MAVIDLSGNAAHRLPIHIRDPERGLAMLEPGVFLRVEARRLEHAQRRDPVRVVALCGMRRVKELAEGRARANAADINGGGGHVGRWAGVHGRDRQPAVA